VLAVPGSGGGGGSGIQVHGVKDGFAASFRTAARFSTQRARNRACMMEN